MPRTANANGTSAIKQIQINARKIRADHPNIAWKDAIKQGSVVYKKNKSAKPAKKTVKKK